MHYTAKGSIKLVDFIFTVIYKYSGYPIGLISKPATQLSQLAMKKKAKEAEQQKEAE